MRVMSERADELDGAAVKAVCEALAEHVTEASEVQIASCAIDIIRALNEAGYTLFRLERGEQ